MDAVKVNCKNEEDHRGKHYEPIQVPYDHPVSYCRGAEVPLTKALGIPLRVHKIPLQAHQLDGGARRFDYNYSNPHIAALNLVCDPNSEDFGWARKGWMDNLRNVLVVRQDMKPLLPQHLEAICEYVRRDWREKLYDAAEQDFQHTSEKEIFELLNEEEFEAFFRKVSRRENRRRGLNLGACLVSLQDPVILSFNQSSTCLESNMRGESSHGQICRTIQG